MIEPASDCLDASCMRDPIAALLVSLALGLLPAVAAEPVPEVVRTGLDRPAAVALQPQTNQLFVWERGRSRVVRIVGEDLEEVLLDLPHPTEPSSTPPQGELPSLAFLNRQTLAILAPDETSPACALYVVEVPAVGSPARPVTSTHLLSAEIHSGDGLQLHGVTTENSALYCALRRADGQDGLGRLSLKNPTQLPAPSASGARQLLGRSFATSGRITCLTISPQGELVGGQVDAKPERPETQITFFRATDGRPLLQLSTRLPPLRSLAYGPRSKRSSASHLYALVSGEDSEGAGLYRMDATLSQGRLQVQPTRIAALQRPTAMAFGSDGSLYVTVAGESSSGTNGPTGQLLRFAPGL